MRPANSIALPVQNYDLAATLFSGQVFNWEQKGDEWSGVIQGRWVRLGSSGGFVHAQTVAAQSDWSWLTHFLQTEIKLAEITASFPMEDPHLQAAIRDCRGLRLLRQEPWECLASFILSSTKQIVQIRQIVRLLSERYGQPVNAGQGGVPCFTFPTPQRLAALTEAELRDCKMGFRAPYLLQAARRVAAGEIELAALANMTLPAAREQLLRFAGVGGKIADCVLLFGYGFPQAFPVDVWVRRVLVKYYFGNRPVREERLRRFIREHFGANAGYCQQYLFHHIRIANGKVLSGPTAES